MPGIKTPENSTQTERKTLHLNGLDFENLEAQPEPVDHEKERAAQEKFAGDAFYGSERGIRKMVKADNVTKKFDDLTCENRLNPEINHGRHFDDIH